MGGRPSTRELLKCYKACKNGSVQGEDFMACLMRCVRQGEDRGKG